MQIGGPTGAFVVIVYGIVQRYGVAGLSAATFMAGVILVCMGFARLGTIIKFIPQPLITGFTSGIAIIIFMPEDADGTKVAAEFKEGVLRVHLPKNPVAKPKTIEVKVD